jgi:hypothetical protein
MQCRFCARDTINTVLLLENLLLALLLLNCQYALLKRYCRDASCGGVLRCTANTTWCSQAMVVVVALKLGVIAQSQGWPTQIGGMTMSSRTGTSRLTWQQTCQLSKVLAS